MHTNFIQLPPDSTGKQLHVQRVLLITVDNAALLRKGDIVTSVPSGNLLRISEITILGAEHTIHAMFVSNAQETITPVTLGDTLQLNGVDKAIVISPNPYYQFFSMTSLVSADNPYNGQLIDEQGSARIRFTEGQPLLSGYGALNTAVETALGVYEASVDSYDALFSIVEENGALSTYSPITSSTILSTTSASGSHVSRTTNRYHYYLPGTSNIMRMSIACGDTGKSGNKRRWGAYDDNDGIFIELNETYGLRFVVRTSTFGVVTDIPIERVDWNGDKLDGTGLSKVFLDVTKINNYWADYQWNGAGRVRIGTYAPDGARIVAHTMYTANAASVPIIRSGTLPLRTENINIALASGTSQLREVCMSIHSSTVPRDNYTFWREADHDVFDVTVTTNSHLLSVQSIQTINGKHNSVQVYPETLNVIVTGGAISLTLWSDVIIPDPTWVPGSSTLEQTTTGTLEFTGALNFKTLFFGEGVHRVDMTPFFELNDEGIMCNGDGSQTIWSFTATKITGTTVTVGMNLGVRELW